MVDRIWSEAQRQLRGALPGREYEFWIQPLRAVRWEGEELTLEVASDFARDWIAREHLSLVERAVALASGRPAQVRLAVNRQLTPMLPERRGPQRAPAAQPVPTEVAPARFSFETFVVGESNAVACRAAQAVVADPGQRFNPLFVHGSFGLGKTHLLSAIADAVGRSPRGGGVACVTAEQFVND